MRVHELAFAVQSSHLKITRGLHHAVVLQRSCKMEFDNLFSGTILPMAGQAPESVLFGSLN